MLSIRHATPDDAAAVTELLGELGYSQPVDFFRERLEIFGQKPDELVLVAEQQGKVIGVLAFRAFLYFHEPGKQGRIIALVVTEKLRSRGAGRQWWPRWRSMHLNVAASVWKSRQEYSEKKPIDSTNRWAIMKQVSGT